MKLALAMPVINHKHETLQCIQSFSSHAKSWNEIELIIIDNGSNPPVADWGIDAKIIRNDVNVGVLSALQQAYKNTSADYIFYTHNDVTMYETDWDSKVIKAIDEANQQSPKGVGIAGFFGSKYMGQDSVYTEPYHIHQLARGYNVSGCYRMDAGHGYRNVYGTWEKVAVLDGYSLIISRKFLDENKGFDMNLPPHHMYDNHTCLQSINLGYDNIVISIDAFHQGGVTDCTETWNDTFGKSKAKIHEEAHYPYFYFYWHPDNVNNGRNKITLPYKVRD